ncbi:hypothetical protein HKBW3S09_01812, partial [Candidatus Hakubella thermalkaliphila]
MATESPDTNRELVELRRQINYWRAQHTRAVERQALRKEKARQLKPLVRQQVAQITESSQQTQTLTEQIQSLTAKGAQPQKQLNGRKYKQAKDLVPESHDGDQEACNASEATSESKNNRGKQPGSKGYGRRRRSGLPTEEILHELPKAEQCCPVCGKPFSVFPGSEDSEEIHWEVRLVRRIHKRTRYRPT